MDKIMNALKKESMESRLPINYLKGQIVLLDKFMEDMAELTQENKVPLRGFDIRVVYNKDDVV